MEAKPHPAKFSTQILEAAAVYLDGAKTVLDPMAGTGRAGKVAGMCASSPTTYANELEASWALQAPANGCSVVTIGDARSLPYGPDTFDAVLTSPPYGNRMADDDRTEEKPGRKSMTYRGCLGEPLDPANAAGMPWGSEFRDVCRDVLREAWRVTRPGGRLVLNVRDHRRDGEWQRAPEWFVSAALAIGYQLLDWTEVVTQGYGYGANLSDKAPELVLCFKKPGKPPVKWAWRFEFWRHGDLWLVQPEAVQLSLLA